METTTQNKPTAKEFALAQIAPYFKDPSTCGYSEENKQCEYLTSDGRMCVAGKNMLNPSLSNISICEILDDQDQSEVFKPEVVGILTKSQWSNLQTLHDGIALKRDEYSIKTRIGNLGLFTYEELVEYADKLE